MPAARLADSTRPIVTDILECIAQQHDLSRSWATPPKRYRPTPRPVDRVIGGVTTLRAIFQAIALLAIAGMLVGTWTHVRTLALWSALVWFASIILALLTGSIDLLVKYTRLGQGVWNATRSFGWTTYSRSAEVAADQRFLRRLRIFDVACLTFIVSILEERRDRYGRKQRWYKFTAALLGGVFGIVGLTNVLSQYMRPVLAHLDLWTWMLVASGIIGFVLAISAYFDNPRDVLEAQLRLAKVALDDATRA